MSTNSQYEESGIARKRSCYTTLSKTWVYSCPHKNINFSGFSGGVNCLCAGMPIQRSTGDQASLTGKQWPQADPDLGWKR